MPTNQQWVIAHIGQRLQVMDVLLASLGATSGQALQLLDVARDAERVFLGDVVLFDFAIDGSYHRPGQLFCTDRRTRSDRLFAPLRRASSN
jgi:hypothetical protein